MDGDPRLQGVRVYPRFSRYGCPPCRLSTPVSDENADAACGCFATIWYLDEEWDG